MTDDTDAADETHQREQGVEFGDLAEELDSHDYPATTDDLLSAYGDSELVFPDGETRTFEEVLSIQQGADEYESADEVRQAVFNMVGSDAVGREGYSDRGAGTAPDETDEESV